MKSKLFQVSVVKGDGVQVASKYKLKIGIDIDDVCWDLVGHWLDWYNRYNTTKQTLTPIDIKSWEINQYVDDTYTLWKILDDPAFWLTIKEPSETQVDMIKWIYDNFDTYFITDTDYKIPKEKFERFFDIYDFVDKERLIICKDKGMINVDGLIDDNPNTIMNVHIPIKFMIKQPWNQVKELNYCRLDLPDIVSILNSQI